MNIVTGYIGADGGTVKINGYDIFAQPEEAKKCIGYLPEIPPLYVDMTVYEYLKFVAELKKLDRKKRKEMIADAMDMTGITEVKNRLIKNLPRATDKEWASLRHFLATRKSSYWMSLQLGLIQSR